MPLNRDEKGKDVKKKPIYKHWLPALLLLLGPAVAGAVGLGKLTVLSLLGQPLSAEVELVSVQADELSTLSARLASLEAYRQSSLQYNAAVAGLHFDIEKRPDGQLYLRLMSERTVTDPFVDLLIELKWASGRLVREYTALIDPPDYAPAPPLVAASPVTLQTRAVALQRLPAAIVTPLSTVATAAGEYGPVRRGETLSKIATSVKLEGVSREQMMLGILRNNPDAFVDNNMNRLKADKVLRIPGQAQLLDTPQADAAREVRLRIADRGQYRRPQVDMTGAAAARKAAARARDKLIAKDQDADEKPVLRLSSGEAPGGAKARTNAERTRALAQELMARERALEETNQRLLELKNTVKESSAKPQPN